MRTETPEFLAKQRAFIEAGVWPNWPVLPMKRYNEDGIGFPQTGVIVATHTTPPAIIIYLDVSPWGVTLEDLKAAETVTFKSLDELLEAGWRVD
jgi:hypothetical protein